MSQNALTSGGRRSVWKHGLVAAVVAAAVTTGCAAAASALGVSFAVDGQAIPLLGFANLTFGFSLIGLLIAAVLARTVQHPRRVWIRTTIVLVLLSFIPDAVSGFDVPSALTLMGLHVVAAAVVVPVIAQRLND